MKYIIIEIEESEYGAYHGRSMIYEQINVSSNVEM